MAEKDSGTPFEERARRLYEESAAELDVETRARLAKARGAALEAAPGPSGPDLWIPVAATAGATAIALALLLDWGGDGDSVDLAASTDDAEDVELLLAAESLDMLSELDFYLWLDAEPDSG